MAQNDIILYLLYCARLLTINFMEFPENEEIESLKLEFFHDENKRARLFLYQFNRLDFPQQNINVPTQLLLRFFFMG